MLVAVTLMARMFFWSLFKMRLKASPTLPSPTTVAVTVGFGANSVFLTLKLTLVPPHYSASAHSSAQSNAKTSPKVARISYCCYNGSYLGGSPFIIAGRERMARLALALLGPLYATLDGQPVGSFGYDKVRALLVYLSIESQRAHDRSGLAALLWPGEPDTVARKNLRTALATLRQTLGDATTTPPFLLISRDTVQFNVASDYELDVATFRALLNEVERHAHPPNEVCAGCAAKLTQASALYRGAFVQHLSVPGSMRWEEWVLAQRTRLQKQALDGLHQLMMYCEQRDENDVASQHAWRALALEPWDEAAHRCLMRAFARSGQRVAALAQYNHCRQMLADELGVEPAAETSALYDQIRVGLFERVAGAALITEPLAPNTPPPMPQAPATLQLNEQTAFGNGAEAEPPANLLDTAVAPQQPILRVADRNRSRILANVRRFWIDGILAQSLHNLPSLELDLAFQLELPAGHRLQLARQPGALQQPIRPGTSIVQVYDDLGGELLILGAPGSGKTTMLLELTRALVARAEQDISLLIPAVFSLSSWATRRLPLAQWLVEELRARYQVPTAIGLGWVETGQVLPLLDGLDEVVPEHRAACVEALNQFRATHWLVPMVVCSRSDEYATVPARLQVMGVVVVQPLTPEQVDAYVAGGDKALAAVRTLLREDAALRELIDTPLMLSIMVQAYQGVQFEPSSTPTTVAHQRRLLFDVYEQRMLALRGGDEHFSASQTKRWLGWLARSMLAHSQTLFFIEGLQPDWLATKVQQRLYTAGVGLSVGLVGGFFIGLANAFTLGILRGLPGLLHGLASGLVGAFVAGPVGALLGVALRGHQPERAWSSVRHALWLGITLGLSEMITGQFAGFTDDALAQLVGGCLIGITVGLCTPIGRIAPVARYVWSWPKTRSRLAAVLAIAALGGLTFGLDDGMSEGVAMSMAGLVVLGLGFGLTTGDVETKTRPNRGILQSAENVYRLGGLFSLAAMVIVGSTVGWSEGSIRGLTQGFSVGMVSALLGGLIAGGLACIQHLVLRVLLWRAGAMPWHYGRFLNHAADRLLLRRVGGGYMFVHRLLLEHIAADVAAGEA